MYIFFALHYDGEVEEGYYISLLVSEVQEGYYISVYVSEVQKGYYINLRVWSRRIELY